MSRFTRLFVSTPILIASMLLLAGCGEDATSIPADALSEDAIAAVHINADQLDDDDVSDWGAFIANIMDEAGNPNADDIEDKLDDLTDDIEDFKDAGGQGLLLLVETHTPKSRIAPPARFGIVVKAGPDADDDDILEALKLPNTIGGPRRARPFQEAELDDLTTQGESTWYALEGDAPFLFTPDGADEESTQRFNRLLAKAGDKAVRAAMPIEADRVKENVQDLIDQVAPHVDVDIEDYNFAALSMLKGLALGFQPGDPPTESFHFQCADEASATRLTRMLDGALLLGRAGFVAAASEADYELDADDLDKLEQAIQFQQDGADVSLTIAGEQWEPIEEVLVPVLGSAHRTANRTANRTQNNANLRSIAQALHNYAVDYGRFPQAGDPAKRFETLIEENYLLPQTLINPVDENKSPATPGPDGNVELTTRNYSYALLSVNSPEWQGSVNSQAPLVADRNTGTADNSASVWNNDRWQGSVAWGDGHVTFESDPTVDTSIRGQNIENDHLFRVDQPRTGRTLGDTYMVYSAEDLN